MTPNEFHGVVEVEPGVYGPCRCEWCQAVARIDALEQQLADQTALVERLREALEFYGDRCAYRASQAGFTFVTEAAGRNPGVIAREALALTPSSAGAERRALEAVAEAASLMRERDPDDWTDLLWNALDHLADVRKGETE